jgi:hypothetical protein
VYEPTAELEEGEEHFVISISELPSPGPPARGSVRTEPPGTAAAVEEEPAESNDAASATLRAALPDVADLVDITRRADSLDPIDAGQLAEGTFLFYGIVLPGEDGNVGFIKRTDPVTALRKGRAFFQFSDALVAIQRPDFMLFPDIDLIVGPTAIAAFRKSALNALLSDVRVVLQDVPAKVREVAKSLTSKVPLTAAATEALERYCSTRPSLAARLRTLPTRVKGIKLTPELVRDALKRHGEGPSLLVTPDGQFNFTGDGVRAFLDIAEGRWFEDEFSGERRRADRYSLRRLSGH